MLFKEMSSLLRISEDAIMILGKVIIAKDIRHPEKNIHLYTDVKTIGCEMLNGPTSTIWKAIKHSMPYLAPKPGMV
jgi:hypothetical protein